MRFSDWSSDVCSSDLIRETRAATTAGRTRGDPAPGRLGRARYENSTGTNSVVPLPARPDGPSSRCPARCNYSPKPGRAPVAATRSEEHTSELQSLMRISYAVFCVKKKNDTTPKPHS